MGNQSEKEPRKQIIGKPGGTNMIGKPRGAKLLGKPNGIHNWKTRLGKLIGGKQEPGFQKQNKGKPNYTYMQRRAFK